jgi:hypothetical protein
MAVAHRRVLGGHGTDRSRPQCHVSATAPSGQLNWLVAFL